MPKPERLEDLGRIRQKLENVLRHSEAIKAGAMHQDNFMDYYKNLDSLEGLHTALKFLCQRLNECASISQGSEYE